jgi:Gas vesicle synthesis protein GvpL/GvpF
MYTYAFLASSTAPVELPLGITGSLALIHEAGLAALVEPRLDLEALQQNDDRLVQAVVSHDRVLRELFEQATILPLRFGTSFISQAALEQHLQTHQAEYLQKLAELQDKAEYGLKFVPSELAEPEISTDVKGKAYFLAKKQRYQTLAEQQQQQQVEFHQVIEAIALSYPDVVLSEAKDGVERVYLLSDRQEEPNLYQRLQNWQMQCPHWQISLVDALPPYHFV